MKNPFIIGDKIYLRGLEAEDLPMLCGWINDAEVTRYMFMGDKPANLDLLREQLSEDLRKTDQAVFAVVDKKSDEFIGTCGLYRINWISRSAEYRIFLGSKENWNKGIGTEIAEHMVKYGFEKLNLNKIWLGVNSENTAANRSYQKAGFIQEGVAREEIFRNNQYYDAVYMSILRREYEK